MFLLSVLLVLLRVFSGSVFWCIYYVFLISLSLRILFILNPIYLSEMSIVTPAVFILGILKKKKPPGLI